MQNEIEFKGEPAKDGTNGGDRGCGGQGGHSGTYLQFGFNDWDLVYSPHIYSNGM